MPRAGLSRTAVVDHALAVVDERGLAALTLADVAARSGVRVPSLYKHVAGLADLRRDVAVRALTELGEALTHATAGRSGADALVELALAYRRYALSWPGRYASTVAAPATGDTEHGAAAEGVLAAVLSALADRGVRGAEAIDATRGLRAAMHGFVTLEAAGGFAMDQSVEVSYRRLVDAVIAGLLGDS